MLPTVLHLVSEFRPRDWKPKNKNNDQKNTDELVAYKFCIFLTRADKNWLKRGEEYDTYLTHVCRYLHSFKISWWKYKEWELSANIVVFIVEVQSTWTADERHSVGWKLPIFIFLPWYFNATDMSQVGIALFSPFQPIFYHFAFPGFFILILNIMI